MYRQTYHFNSLNHDQNISIKEYRDKIKYELIEWKHFGLLLFDILPHYLILWKALNCSLCHIEGDKVVYV